MSYKAIPQVAPPTGWQHTAIRECGEPLVSMSTFFAHRIHLSPQYFLQRLPQSFPEILLRRGVAERLISVASSLPGKLGLLLFDGWRPTALQVELFDRHRANVQRKHPGRDGKSLLSEVAKYVSVPSADRDCPSPHLTGGAIDLTLCEPDGSPLQMGTAFDDFDPSAAAAYFEREDSPRDETFLQAQINRRILYGAMTAHGFTAYSEEWWHYDYGNQFWAIHANRDAIYGAVFSHPPTV